MTTRANLIAFASIGLALSAASFIGCGSTPSEDGQAQSGTESRNASLRRSIDVVGIWLGRATLNRTALDQFLATLSDPNERLRVTRIADTFESISIAMDFRSDSTMEIEVEIVPPDEAPFRRSSLGTWKLIDSDERSITLECSEEIEPGKFEHQTLTYEFTADRNQLTTVAPVGDDLKPYEPKFVFERCDETQIAEQPGGESTILR